MSAHKAKKKKTSQARATEDAVAVASRVEAAHDTPHAKRRLRVTAVAAAAVALTAKDHALTADEEQQLKTRLQYRLYQRNHRAKKQRHADELETEIAALRDEIARLETKKYTLQTGCTSQILAHFLAAFRSPAASSSIQTGEARLRDMLVETPRAERLVGQWRLLCECFSQWELEIPDQDGESVPAQDEQLLVVLAPLMLRLCATRDELAAEFPALTKRSLELLSTRGESADIQGRAAFHVDSVSGQLVAWTLDLDLIASLKLLTKEPLEVIERVVSSSQQLQFMSDAGSDVWNTREEEARREPQRMQGTEHERHSVDYLLSG